MSSPTAGERKTVIVIAFDGSPTARRAVHYASKFLTADRAVVLTVWSALDRGTEPVSYDLDGPPDPTDTDEVDIALTEAQRINDEGLDLALATGLRRAVVHRADLHGVGHDHRRRRRVGGRSDRHRHPRHHRVQVADPIQCGRSRAA